MSTKKISQLPVASTLTGAEYVPLVQDGATVRGTVAAILAQMFDANAVHKTGSETITGIKNFLTGIIVPDGSLPQTYVANLVADLAARALDSAVVKLTGNQTIAGVKTFSSAPVVPDGSWSIADTTGLQVLLDAKRAKHASVIYVTDHGAVGDGVADDTVAVQAALDAATAVGSRLGARVVFPAGTYRLSDELVIPATSPETFVELCGEHQNVSRLYWPIDLGAGKFGIRQAAATTYPYAHHIHDLHLIGPGISQTPVDGTPPALMNGIQMKQRWVVERLVVQYFNAGITPSDHTSISECAVNGNYYGMRWADTFIGDIYVEHCDFGSNRMASIGVKSGVFMVSTQWNSCHFGIASPYAIYLESGATPHLLADNQWINCSFEGLILALLYDEDNDGTIMDQEFIGGGCSWGGYDTTMGETRSELVRTSVWRGISNRGNVSFYITAAGVPAVRCAEFSRNHMESFEEDQASATTNGVALIVGPTAGSCDHNHWSYRGGSTRGRFGVTGSAVTRGQVLAQRNVGTVRAYNIGNANEPVAGIAMATLAGAGVVPFAVEGEAVRCQYTGSPVAGDYAVISASAKDKVASYSTTVALAGDLPAHVLGTVYSTATTDADAISRVPVTLYISMSGDAGAVHKTGNETIDGIKTFTSSPVVPNPTTAQQAASKAYVDSTVGASLPVFYVGAPATSGGAGKDKSAVLAAVAAATAATNGGVVLFGPGTYDVGDAAIVLPAYSTGKQVSLHGSGRESTFLYFSTDRGATAYAICGSAARESDNYFCTIADMRIVGPVPRPATIGTWPADSMTGIRWGRGMTLERLDIAGFYVGAESDSNHCDMRTCTISNNYYGVYFTTSAYGGDVTMDHCDLGGNLMASIAVSGTHATRPELSDGLATFAMIKGHMGFSPYGIYIESGAGAGLSLGGVLMVGTSWEFLGNGAIFSADQTARVDGLVLHANGVFSNNGAAYKIAATPYSAHVKVASLLNATFTDTNMTGVVGPPDAFIDVSSELQDFRWTGWLDSYATAKAAGVPLIWGPSIQALKNIVLDSGEALTAFAAPCSQFFAVAAGEIVERRDIGTLQPYGSQGATSKGQIAGVALNGMAASSREYVLCATKGHDVTVLSDGAVGITDVLIPSTANPTKVVGLQSDGTIATVTKPILGRPYIATGGAGTVRTHLDIR